MAPADSSSPLRILLIEDDRDDALFVRKAFEKSQVPCELTHCFRAEEALERLHHDPTAFDVVVTDYLLPGMSGLDLISDLFGKDVDMPLVMLTGAGSEHLAVEALKAGFQDYLIKDPGQGYLSLLPVVLPEVVRQHRDRIARVDAENALRDNEERLKILFEFAPDAYYLHDLQGNFVDGNKAAESLFGFGRKEFSGKNVRELGILPEDQLARFSALLSENTLGNPTGPEEFSLKRRDGQKVNVEVRTFPVRIKGESLVLGIARDISQRKIAEEETRRLERQVLQSQKLESLGVLAGGIAHDFNNLLTGMLGNANLALLALPEDSPVRDYIQEMETAGHRAAELTNQILAYSGRAQFVMREIDLTDLVRDMVPLLEASVSKSIALKYDLDSDLPAVRADAAQIQQVVMNLVTNASEAIGEASGNICVTTGVVQCDREFLAETSPDEDLPEARYAFIEVADTGSGMDGETRSRIFDPFFTTKFMGRGLGLAAVQGIVRSHKGVMKVFSEPGMGSTLTVFFPCLRAPLAAAPSPEETESHRNGKGKILIVDDEETVRNVARRILEINGYSVLTANDGREGIEVFRRHAQEIAAVLLDMTMPHLSGESTFTEMRRIRPDVRVVLSSGYSESEATERFAGKGLAGFIQKPYSAKALAEKIGAILQG
ncbi:response regulator [Candidatus Sumerlaeota bacterium]|nr:response regulator [Candidatus Sumerlaeota bacterium]